MEKANCWNHDEESLPGSERKASAAGITLVESQWTRDHIECNAGLSLEQWNRIVLSRVNVQLDGQ
jgi:hypothetical protein